MNVNLEREERPVSRSATALGCLVACCREAAGCRAPKADTRERLWTNRPGQDRAETFTLATLITLTVSGLAAGWIAERLRPESGSGWLAVAILTVPGFFAVIHLLIFAASAIDTLLRLTGIRVDLPPGHFCGRLVLGMLTAICLIELNRSGAGLWLRAISAAWVGLAGLNALAWLFFRARGLLRDLARDDPD